MPLIEAWKNKQETQETTLVEDLLVKVVEVKPGKEIDGMVVDTLVRFEVNGKNLVAHCYNTTAKVLINGSGYSKFVDKYLEPHFQKVIGENMLQIQNYNSMVTETFGIVKRKDVKFRPGKNDLNKENGSEIQIRC